MLIRRSSGFSLIELMVAVTVLAILTAVALPNFTSWIRNARARTVADALQSGMRLAQAEAQRRTHTVVFFLTNNTTCNDTAVANANGTQWQVRVVPDALLTEDNTAGFVKTVRCGVLTDVSAGVTLTGVAAVCFGGDGRQTTVTDPTGIGVNCTAAARVYDISPPSGSDSRPLRMTVSLAGSIRMCDPGKSSTSPDGCR
ncbi:MULTISPECIES: Tfp pilus assembly protein FimT/FimU [unclassified Roseateles]|uniref:pilus assembly FimT family protein n=1 Tax=unclassified Roseateles TaxID=2626991 RepID=UPI0006F93604|nr:MULTISPECIES: GspH/FimT family pseudopilin [unclassified Roseateles]KQW51706.1 hypothetical protein ASC81_03545 [Pelomonas sp. Root405]KRA77939.1 hypothetical protein ASD88_03545 [Pelomonas sp. Root662]